MAGQYRHQVGICKRCKADNPLGTVKCWKCKGSFEPESVRTISSQETGATMDMRREVTDMPYKSVYVEARQEQSGKYSLGPYDPSQFGMSIAEKANRLEAEGYDVIAVLPVITGTMEMSSMMTAGHAMGFGKTRGAILLAKK